MEHVTPFRTTSPNENSSLKAPQIHQKEPPDSPWQSNDRNMDLIDYWMSAAVHSGEQYALDTGFPIQGPMDFSASNITPNEWQTQESRSKDMAAVPSRSRFTGPDMTANMHPDPGISNQLLEYVVAARIPSGPRNLLDPIDRIIPILERNCHAVDPLPVTREEMSRLSVSDSNPAAHDGDWLPGSNRQFPFIGSTLRPYSRPAGLGNEYVYGLSNDPSNTNPMLVPHQQAEHASWSLSDQPKPTTSIQDTSKFLSPNQPYIGRRKPVPHGRLIKPSSRDQGLDHTPNLSLPIRKRSQAAGTQVFDARMNVKSGRRKRRYSKDEREQIANTRKYGACQECRMKKRKV